MECFTSFCRQNSVGVLSQRWFSTCIREKVNSESRHKHLPQTELFIKQQPSPTTFWTRFWKAARCWRFEDYARSIQVSARLSIPNRWSIRQFQVINRTSSWKTARQPQRRRSRAINQRPATPSTKSRRQCTPTLEAPRPSRIITCWRSRSRRLWSCPPRSPIHPKAMHNNHWRTTINRNRPQ